MNSIHELPLKTQKFIANTYLFGLILSIFIVLIINFLAISTLNGNKIDEQLLTTTLMLVLTFVSIIISFVEFMQEKLYKGIFVFFINPFTVGILGVFICANGLIKIKKEKLKDNDLQPPKSINDLELTKKMSLSSSYSLGKMVIFSALFLFFFALLIHNGEMMFLVMSVLNLGIAIICIQELRMLKFWKALFMIILGPLTFGIWPIWEANKAHKI